MKDLIKTKTSISSFGRRFASEQAGSTTIEYTLIAAGISVAIIIAVYGIGSEVLALFSSALGIF